MMYEASAKLVINEAKLRPVQEAARSYTMANHDSKTSTCKLRDEQLQLGTYECVQSDTRIPRYPPSRPRGAMPAASERTPSIDQTFGQAILELSRMISVSIAYSQRLETLRHDRPCNRNLCSSL